MYDLKDSFSLKSLSGHAVKPPSTWFEANVVFKLVYPEVRLLCADFLRFLRGFGLIDDVMATDAADAEIETNPRRCFRVPRSILNE